MDDQDLTKDQTGFLSAFNQLLRKTEVTSTNLNDAVNVIPAESIKKKSSQIVLQQVCNPYKATKSKAATKKQDSNPKSTPKKLVGKSKATPKKNQARKEPKSQVATSVPKTKATGTKDLTNYKMNNADKTSPTFNDVINLNNQDFEPTQTNWMDALKSFKEELGVLNHEEYDETLNELPREESK